MADSDGSLKLIQCIYDAALDPNLWSHFLDKAAYEMGATHSLLLLLDQNSLTNDIVLVRGLDPAIEAEYHNRVDEDIWAAVVFSRPSGRTWVSEELVDPRDLHRTAFYADIALPSQWEHNVVAAISGSATKMLFSCIRGAQQGPYSETDKQILQHLVPHLSKARKIHHQFAGHLSLIDGIKQALDRSPCGVAVVSSTGAVAYMNSAMDALLERDCGLVMNNRCLQLKHPYDQRQFYERIQHATEKFLQIWMLNMKTLC